MIPVEEVDELARASRVKVWVKGEHIWEEGDLANDELIFLVRGHVEYHRTEGPKKELVDIRDVGDLMGLAALVEGKPIFITAEVVEDSLCYILPWQKVNALLQIHDTARSYVHRHLFWATRVGRKVSLPSETAVPTKQRNILQAHLDGGRVIQLRPIDRLLICHPDDSIHEAATLMVTKRVPSILVVDENRWPLGIVLGSNIVKHVVVGGIATTEPVSRIMAKPVYTVSPSTSATAAILLMLRERIGQICVTENGTLESKALDVCTHKDLLAQSGHHPAGLIREIRLAKTSARFRDLCDEIERIAFGYLEAGISAIFLGQICAELYDELVQQMITVSVDELVQQQIKLPSVKWAWIAVGSDGRREQVLRTDMDNGFIFESTGSPHEDEQNRGVFLRLNERVIELMVDAGFSRCQGGVMASNRKWCQTDQEWMEEIKRIEPSIDGTPMLRAMILYDLRFVAGEQSLALKLRNEIFGTVSLIEGIQMRMAESIVETPPPINFWGKFIVEDKGRHKGEFDVKARGLSPLRDGTRLFAMKYGLSRHYSTGGRLDDIETNVPDLVELVGLIRDSYDFLMGLRLQAGFKRGDSGRFIDPETLRKLQRSQLSNVFDVQRMLQARVRQDFHILPRKL